jgi:hypothetical protein
LCGQYGGCELKKAQSHCYTQPGTRLAFYAGMRVAGPTDITSRTGLKVLAAMPRICEKSSASSALGREQQGFNEQDGAAFLPMPVELVCQEGTANFDPFWDGPKLLPAFAAQLMGQMTQERRDSQVPVETAYGRINNPRMALLLDRKS